MKKLKYSSLGNYTSFSVNIINKLIPQFRLFVKIKKERERRYSLLNLQQEYIPDRSLSHSGCS